MPEPDLLTRIIHRRQELNALARSKCPDKNLKKMVKDAPPVRAFEAALRVSVENNRPAVIAELKQASPSKGLIRQDFDVAGIAAGYQRGGASALSVLTEPEFFQGDMSHLRLVRDTVDLPLLCKDFMVEERQFYEARIAGADCVLLIAAALDDVSLGAFKDLAWSLGMDVLVEIHNREELTRAISLKTGLIGVNNRDLKSFVTDINTTLGLLTDVPEDRLIVTESGINDAGQITTLRNKGVHAFLVGESLMRAADPGLKLKNLFFPED